MKNEGIGSTVIVVVVIIIAAAAAGGYIILSEEESWAGGKENIAWEDISSLKFKIKDIDKNENVTAQGTIWVKNIGTQNRKARTDATIKNEKTGELSVEREIIVNEEVENAWFYVNENWVPTDNFEYTLKKILIGMINDIENNFSGWTKGENITITEEGMTTKLYDIEINPNPKDSLFEDPTT